MTIKFYCEGDEVGEELLSFERVEENQFFVNKYDELCQKSTFDVYNVIANENREPYARLRKIVDHHTNNKMVKRILPTVTKIEF